VVPSNHRLHVAGTQPFIVTTHHRGRDKRFVVESNHSANNSRPLYVPLFQHGSQSFSPREVPDLKGRDNEHQGRISAHFQKMQVPCASESLRLCVERRKRTRWPGGCFGCLCAPIVVVVSVTKYYNSKSSVGKKLQFQQAARGHSDPDSCSCRYVGV